MKKVLNILIIISLSFLFAVSVSAKENDRVKVHVFYAEWCSNCQNLHSFLNDLTEDKNYNKMFEVVYYRVDNDSKYGSNAEYENNMELYHKVRDYYGDTIDDGIPLYFIGNSYKVGFSPTNSPDEIKKLIKENYYRKGKDDIIKDIMDSNVSIKQKELSNTKIIGIVVIVVTIIVAGVILVIYLKNR